MQKIIEPQYTFSFIGSDGQIYSRQLYWESLYVFSYKNQHVLVAARCVPHSSMQYALYEAMKGKDQERVFQKLLPDLTQDSSYRALNEAKSTDLIESVIDLLPEPSSSISEDLFKVSQEELEETVSNALVGYGLPRGLDTFSNSGEVDAFGRRFSDPLGTLHILAGLEGKDAGIVNLSYHIDAVLKARIRESLEASVSDQVLVHHSDFEVDVYRRLYSNPKYLSFVKQVMNARGSYISPVVRDFLSFYAKCFNMKLNEYARKEHVDPEILKKRIEGMLGREKGISHFSLPYHELTILGYVHKGNLEVDQSDPDSSSGSFKVDPQVDVSNLLIQEIRGHTQRFLVKTVIQHTFNRNHNIKTVWYIDDPQEK